MVATIAIDAIVTAMAAQFVHTCPTCCIAVFISKPLFFHILNEILTLFQRVSNT